MKALKKKALIKAKTRKSENKIKSLLEKVERLTKRIQALKNPPDKYKIEIYDYRVLLCRQGLYKYLLGDKGYEFDDYHDHFLQNLDTLENNS
jgi:hypothetical protein